MKWLVRRTEEDNLPGLVSVLFTQHEMCLGLTTLKGKGKALTFKAVGLQEVEDPKVSRQSAHEGGKVVSPKHRLPLPSRRYPR